MRGHPWVYKTEIAEVEGEFASGDVVDVLDHRGRFLGRGYANPASLITVRLLTRRMNEEIDRAFWRRRVEAALAYRRKVLRDAETDAYRLLFAEADGVPGFTADVFGDQVVVQALTLGSERFKGVLVDLIAELLAPRGIYERSDAPARLKEGLEPRSGPLRGSPKSPVVIREGDLRFLVDTAGGQKTGFFLDQRENRRALRKYAKGARVLDCFCYTGGFALHAARAGARSVLGIDISAEAVEFARENARLNGLEGVCTFEAANAFDALRELERSGEKFDLVILDPPAFVKSRRALEGALRGYKEINLRALKLLAPGGILVTCSCSYHLPEELFLEVLLAAATDAGRTLRVVERRGQAPDHPWLLGYEESRYLKCFFLEVR